MIEPLEPRIAPAAISLTYVDGDGDIARITASKAGPARPPLDLADLTFIGGGSAGQLAEVNLTEPGFAGANISISIIRQVGVGDGRVHVGKIEAGGRDLGTVTVVGDLGQIDAGDSNLHTPGLKKLSVLSMGVFGLDTQGGSGDLFSGISGALSALTVAGHVEDVYIRASAIGAVTIGGSLFGGSNDLTGMLHSLGNFGPVKIVGSIVGGGGFRSGAVIADGTLANVSIGGSVRGGDGDQSGLIFSGKSTASVKVEYSVLGGNGAASGAILSKGSMGPVWIGDDLRGSFAPSAGQIAAEGNIARVTVRGTLAGGLSDGGGVIAAGQALGPVSIGEDVRGLATGTGIIQAGTSLTSVSIGGSLKGGLSHSGAIFARGALGPVKIGGDLQGGNSGGTDAQRTGYIEADRIASVSIGGSMKAGLDDGPGSLIDSAAIRAHDNIGPIFVKGSILGTSTPDGIARVSISARGQAVPTATTDLAIASLTVGGSVEYAAINVGFSTIDRGLNADAQIGAVRVGGHWTASHLLVGVDPGPDGKVGTSDDRKLAGNYGSGPVHDGRPISRIASIAIGQNVVGTGGTNADHFGFVAEHIGAFRSLGYIALLTAGKDGAHTLNPGTNDIAWREIQPTS